MAFEQSPLDRFCQVSGICRPCAPVANVTAMREEAVLARLDYARRPSIRTHCAHIDNERSASVTRRIIDDEPKVILTVNFSAAKKRVARCHRGCRQAEASVRSRKSSA